MLSSIKKSMSGLLAQVQRLTTIGNNISNISTTAFKRSDASFSEVLSDDLDTSSLPLRPGTNLGVFQGASHVSELVFSQGSWQPTGRSLDLALEGDGFVELRDQNGRAVYVKGGSFSRDGAGRMVHSSGSIIPGVQLPEGSMAIDINARGEVQIVGDEGLLQLGTLRIVKFVNPGGLESLGGGQYLPTENTGVLTVDRETKVWQGFLESSNVSLTEEMTSLMRAQRAYQANAQAIRTFDEMWGKSNSLRR